MKAELLARVKRGSLTEREYTGFICLVDQDENIIYQAGDSCDQPFFMRSCAKPLQALPVLKSGAFESFGIDLKDLAIFSSSHSASKEHIEVIKSIFEKTKLCENDLQCGFHEPIDADMKNFLIKNGINNSPIYHNCSGKHLGMLSVCLKMGWDRKNYLEPEHPLQQEIFSVLKEFCGFDPEKFISYDGCGAPVSGIPLSKMGAGFLKLFLAEEKIKQAYVSYPELIGGKGRLDSSIIEASGGELIAKTGADGLCIVANIAKKQALVVKVLDSNINIRSLIVLDALALLKWELDFEHAGIKKLFDPFIRTSSGIIAGRTETLFSLEQIKTK